MNENQSFTEEDLQEGTAESEIKLAPVFDGETKRYYRFWSAWLIGAAIEIFIMFAGGLATICDRLDKIVVSTELTQSNVHSLMSDQMQYDNLIEQYLSQLGTQLAEIHEAQNGRGFVPEAMSTQKRLYYDCQTINGFTGCQWNVR